MGTVLQLKESREAPKASRSSMETLIVTTKEVTSWKLPPFQRELRVTEKVRMITELIKRDECIPGILTLGKIAGSPTLYKVDGQHRIEAFKASGLQEVIADVRIVIFDNMAEMAAEFVQLNSSLVAMRPDDVLRGLEPTLPLLRLIRHRCEFVGYDMIRRSLNSPVVSVSATLRCWFASHRETPAMGGMGAAAVMANSLEANDVGHLITFLQIAEGAWGRDPENYRLWGSLNLTMCMWLWRRLVVDKERGTLRRVILNEAQFKKCLMRISADDTYIDWLQGRTMKDRDRWPCYRRLSAFFVKSLAEQGMNKPHMPKPAWASST